MQKIGEGYYYSVYEVSATRVFKKETSYKSRLTKLQAWYEGEPKLLEEKISRLEESALNAIALSRELASIPELKDLLGNPTFVSDTEYEQDRAVPLGNLADQEGFLSYLQEYIEANYLLWSLGYGEVVYNFTLNVGVSVITSRVILLDFNELTNSKQVVIKDIEAQKWLTQASMLGLKETHPELHSQAERVLNSAFTRETLDKLWASRC